MSTGNESSMMSCIHSRTTSSAGGSTRLKCSFSRRFFRPWALGFIALAISVALWGYGYRISRYKPHPEPSSRTLLVKMWDKHQDLTQVAGATNPSVQPHFQLELHAALLLLRLPLARTEWASYLPDGCKRIPALFRAVVPLRSPPSNNLLA